jgi:hypothetical protein
MWHRVHPANRPEIVKGQAHGRLGYMMCSIASPLLHSMVVVVDAHIYNRQARAALVCVNGQARWPPESDAGGEPGKKTLFFLQQKKQWIPHYLARICIGRTQQIKQETNLLT